MFRYCEPSPGNRKASLPCSGWLLNTSPVRVIQRGLLASATFFAACCSFFASSATSPASTARRTGLSAQSRAARVAARSSSATPGLLSI